MSAENKRPETNEEHTFSGWLAKKKSIGSSKRYCRIADGYLYIAKDDKCSVIDKKIKLDPQLQITVGEKSRFKIVENPPEGKKVSVTLEADSNATMMSWVLTLRGYCFLDPKLSLDDFDIVSVLGRGHFGKVMLVQKKDNKEFYAIKTIRKDKVIKANKLHTIMNERNVLMKVNHPFIISMKFAFQTSSKFYFGMEYACGGELFALSRKIGKLTVDQVRPYLAEMALAIHYLHTNGIIYRDLKPENILLDADGHLKLTDFGLAKEMPQNATTRTLCGTPEYAAPELIRKRKYGMEVDWWAFGILAHDLIFRRTPFRHKNTQIIYEKILKEEPEFKNDADPRAVEFIKFILKKNPMQRPGFAEIIKHKFFEGIDFEEVMARKVVPPFIPQVNMEHPTNFESKFLNENAVDSYVPPPSVALNVGGFSVEYMASDGTGLLMQKSDDDDDEPEYVNHLIEATEMPDFSDKEPTEMPEILDEE